MPRTEESFDTLLGYLLSRASNLVDKQFVQVLKGHGLTLPAWRVIASLSRNNDQPIVKLASQALMQQPTLTKILERLESQDLVARRPDSNDGRVYLVHLTREGRRLVSVLTEQGRQLEKQDLAGLSATERRVLKRELRRLMEKLEAHKQS